MPKFRFFPESWTPDDKLIEWAHSKGLSDKDIADQTELIKFHEFAPMRSCARRTWQRWITNAIRYGHVTPSVQREHRRPESNPESAEDRQRKFEENLENMNKSALRVVK